MNAISFLHYHRYWLWVGSGLVLLVIYLSLTAHPPKLLHFHASDKLEHFVAYFVLMGWFVQLYRSARARLFWATLFVTQGMVIEVVQGMSRWRTFDYYDVLANTLGIVLAWWWSFHGLDRLLPALEHRLHRHRTDR